MKMYEVIEFANLYEKIKESKMPLKTAYNFSRLMRQLEKEVVFYQTEFTKIIQSYAKKDEDGKFVVAEDGESVEIVNGKEIECNTKIFELKNLEVEITDISFKLEELSSLDLTIGEISCILSLIEE